MRNIMIDLETVGMEPDSAIAQIGMVMFEDDFNIIGQYCINLDIDQQFDKGSTFEDDTVVWWLGQKADNPELYHSVFDNPIDSNLVYENLTDWLNEYKLRNNEGFRLWANHLLFDVPISNRFLGYYGDNWKNYVKYNKFEDFATLRETAKRFDSTFKQIEDNIQIEAGSSHNALYDAIWQTKSLEVCYDLMGIKL